LKFHALI